MEIALLYFLAPPGGVGQSNGIISKSVMNGMAEATRLRSVVSKARCIFPSEENLLASSLRSPLPSVEEPCPLSLSDGLLQQPTFPALFYI
jgi:hypothetical protein